MVLLLTAIGAAGCATPSSPTGGPPDREGPTIIRTEPETGTTNFSGRTITLHFSEFVERSTLQNAIVIEPDIGIEYKLDWGRKSVEIQFEQEIPDLTTLIVTIGTEFEDVNGNEMASPHKIAVSTGPEIDDGKLVGNVLNAETGKGEKGNRILLYRDPVDLSEKADYIASTDTSGRFTFSYLRQGKYKAFWVNDINRNKIWDRSRERAQPFGEEYITLEKSATDTLGSIYITQIDTTRPSLQGVGLFSSQRLRMRFSENIQLTDTVSLAVTDTSGNELWSAYPLYILPEERFVLFGQSEQPLDPQTMYSINVSGIVDGFDNPLKEVSQQFTGSAQEDTTRQRIIERNNLAGYFPDESVIVTYAKPITESEIMDSLKVVAGDTLIENWSGAKVERNKLIISPDGNWRDGRNYEIRVWDPIVSDYRKVKPDIWHSSQTGSLSLAMQDSSDSNVQVEITNEKSGITRDTMIVDSLVVKDLPPLQYTVSAFIDINGNGQWDNGQVAPFEAPEPYFIQAKVPVERSMTGEMTLIFK